MSVSTPVPDDEDEPRPGPSDDPAVETAWNRKVIREYRENGGRFGETPLLLLHHRGARTGTQRINPMAYLEDDGRYVVFASHGGAPTSPGWYHNVCADPHVEIEVGHRRLAVTARTATGEERERLWAAQVAAQPGFAEYQRKTDRLIPVVVLTPAAD